VYSQAIRDYLLAHLALANVILELIDFTTEDCKTLNNILDNLDRFVILSAIDNASFQMLLKIPREIEKTRKLTLLQNCGFSTSRWLTLVSSLSKQSEWATLSEHHTKNAPLF